MRTENQELLEEFFSYHELSEDDREEYRVALSSWDLYTDTPLTDLSEETLIQWYNKAVQEHSKATLEKYGKQFRTIYASILQHRALAFLD